MKPVLGLILLFLVAVTNGQLPFRRYEINPQCDIIPPFRSKCGQDGISEEGCTALGCCYGFGSLPNIPRCYNKKGGIPAPNPDKGGPPPNPAPKMKCDVIPPFRSKCADDNISKADCLSKGCCYGFDTLPGIPRCYHQGN